MIPLRWYQWILLAFLLVGLAACTPAVMPTSTVSPTKAVFPTKTPGIGTATPLETLTPVTEGRLVELEWPSYLRLGESDIVRLALVPGQEGYRIEAEFQEHTLQSEEVKIKYPEGYTLMAVASLDGVGFDIAPSNQQESMLPSGERVDWRWTVAAREPGQQRLSISLWLKWLPETVGSAPVRESLVFSRGLDVKVRSFFGLTYSQVLAAGILGIFLGGGISLLAIYYRLKSSGPNFKYLSPNPKLVVEPPPGMVFSPEELDLLRAMFSKHARLILLSEFLSGYSGARTLLALPIRTDGRSDAQTIIKIAAKPAIRREYENYENYVKDRLPPVTARIQQAPVMIRSSLSAALRYTFIAKPGQYPASLREALLAEPDPRLIYKLFDTFGPNWWMQRKPYVFRLFSEYDRLLPPHYVLAPVKVGGTPVEVIGEDTSPLALQLDPGALVWVHRFKEIESRLDEKSLTLIGRDSSSNPALRLRWLRAIPPENTLATVVATRRDLFDEVVKDFDRLRLPDPLQCLDSFLAENVMGTQSIIHGDLNLENILVGPGNFAWLIDFAQTRQGHTLFDFARLKVELMAHIISPQADSGRAFLAFLKDGHPLLNAVDEIASRCFFNPNQPREYHLGVAAASLGALKYSNLDLETKHRLYLAASYFTWLLTDQENP